VRASAAIEIPGPTVAVEQVWYDPSRWASWVDGLAHVTRLDDHWPQAGARRIWSSPPGGRGMVSETVLEYRVREGQTLEVEDERLAGIQRVLFVPAPAGTRVRVELELEPKERMPPGRRWWVGRKLGESLRRTLTRFSYEVAADLQR
jgi:hypothetical protein